MKNIQRAIGISAVAVFTMLGTACDRGGGTEGAGNRPAGGPQHVTRAPEGEDLLTTMKKVADSGKGFSLKDATSLDRYIYPAEAKAFVTCFQVAEPKMQAVDIYAAPKTEKCPVRLHARVTAPKVPKLTGERVDESLLKALNTGYFPNRLKVSTSSDFGNPVPMASAKPFANWHVCAQNPGSGAVFDAKMQLKLYAAKKCP
ncbi:hypothetical protein AB0M41_01650 [Streptomyces sp. NPDC051896]|uniref:hypothetical protein n=1 Tax=Streptomyces sp. NPDC051896 TaxID=3155416 RepID=UPI00342ABDED